MSAEQDQSEKLVKVTGEEAAKSLYQIWYMYELSSKRPENDKARQEALSGLNKVLSEEAMDYLEEEVAAEVDEREVTFFTRGMQIKDRATQDAIKERARNRSQGEKLAIRRNKANERRGTKRGLIH